MQLKKTKLAGIISLLFCSNAMAVVFSDPPIAVLVDSSRFGPFVSAMDTSSAAASTAVYTNTYAQSFTYDIGAPWTYGTSQYDIYCVYDDEVCDMFWDGSKSDGSDGLHQWRINILNTFAGAYNSESTVEGKAGDSVKVTAFDGTKPVGYSTVQGSFVRRAFYDATPLLSEGDSDNNGGFSSAYDVTQVNVKSNIGPNVGIEFTGKLIVGQSNTRSSGSSQFDYCFNYGSSDDRYDYGDLYNCPGYDLQASYWNSDALGVNALYFSSGWLSNSSDAVLIANAYAINTSGVAVGFSTKQIYSSTGGGRARAVVFQPEVKSTTELNYTMSEISKPESDGGGSESIRDTVAVDITDTIFDAGEFKFPVINTDAEGQAFIVVGNRTFAQPENRNYTKEFFTYNAVGNEVRYPFRSNPIKGANSQASKINNDGLVVGWRDGRGETSPTVDGSARYQSAFIYDYKSKSSAYLDDLYCGGIPDADVKYRFTNAISISEMQDTGDGNDLTNTYTIVANGSDYKNVENYKNRVGSSPVVLTMTVTRAELNDFDNSSQCPIKADEPYERGGAGMGWFVLLPTMMLLFRRFKR